MQRRLPGDRVQFERIQAGLASVPLAVAASSAFPAFFPPIRLKSADIGASSAAFSQQTFTDGGVFDNLGVRGCFGSSSAAGPRNVGRRRRKGEKWKSSTSATGRRPTSVGNSRTWPPATMTMTGTGTGTETGPPQPAALARRSDVQEKTSGAKAMLGPPGPERAQGAYQPSSPSDFDAVIVSDAGAKLTAHHDASSGGLVQTAMRASDILMDRVWQLEKEIFGATPGFLFTPIHQIVEREDDPHAIEPVVQRQAIGMRTDIDRFSNGEIRTLVQHGYAVMRQACKSRPDIFGYELPDGKPWDPIPPTHPAATLPPGRPGRPPAATTLLARELQQSAFRRIASTLLDWRDGMTYIFLPFVMVLVLSVPLLIGWSYIHISRDERALRTIAASDRDEAKVIALLQDGGVHTVKGMPVVDVDHLAPPDYRGFSIINDGHIVDFRGHDGSLLIVGRASVRRDLSVPPSARAQGEREKRRRSPAVPVHVQSGRVQLPQSQSRPPPRAQADATGPDGGTRDSGQYLPP